jgi:hypothetical protein
LRVTTPLERLELLRPRGVDDAPGLRGVTWRTGVLLRSSSWSSREQIGHLDVSRL